jgi:hypothetical protein
MISSTEGFLYSRDDTTDRGCFASNESRDDIYKRWEEEVREKKRRIKMKGDPNELRKKANNKSTRPKWLK